MIYGSESVVSENSFLKSGKRLVTKNGTLDSGNTDGGTGPAYRFRAGNVVVLRTSTRRYVEADDANGDRNGAASISSSSYSNSTGNDIVLVYKGGSKITVTVSSGTGTASDAASDLNGNADFAAHFDASASGGEVTITTRQAGSDEWFYVHADTHDAYGFSEGESNAVRGTDADYAVTAEKKDLEDRDGNAVHRDCPLIMAGHFDESDLINLTEEAKGVLLNRGSIFE